MSKTLPPFETWHESWQCHGWNNCLTHAADALIYLTKHDMPTGGEQTYNAIDLDQTAYDVKRTIAAMWEYRNRING